MMHRDPISEDHLNALLDNELDTAEREFLLQEIRADKTNAQRYCELRQMKDLVTLAYQDVSTTRRQLPVLVPRLRQYGLSVAGVVAAMMLAVVSTVGIMRAQPVQFATPIQTLAQLDAAHTPSNKILLHVSSLDAQRVNAALDAAEMLVSVPRVAAAGVQVEIVANADGLGVLRQGSPYADRIRALARKHDNLQFSACANTKHLAHLQSGKEVSLLPEAQEVPNALDQIVKRLANGWLYVKV